MLTIFVGQPPIVTSYLFIYLYFEFIIFSLQYFAMYKYPEYMTLCFPVYICV